MRENSKSEQDYNTLIHYGVMGMKWGVRKQRKAALKQIGKGSKRDIRTKKNKINAKYDVKKYGGTKSKALAKMQRNANAKAKAKSFVKKGAGYLASLSTGVIGMNMAAANASATTAAIVGAKLITSAVNPMMPVALLGASLAGMAVTAKIKSKTSKKDAKRIENVKKYG